jgi:hypothetical protein
VKITTGKTQLWSTWYWCVNFKLEEDEYDNDPAWAMYLSSRRMVVPGVLMGVSILSGAGWLNQSTPPAGGRPVTIRATVMPLRKDGSHSTKTEIYDFDHNDTERFARLPKAVQDAYRTFCDRRDDVLLREKLLNEEENRRRIALSDWWHDLFVSEQETTS